MTTDGEGGGDGGGGEDDGPEDAAAVGAVGADGTRRKRRRRRKKPGGEAPAGDPASPAAAAAPTPTPVEPSSPPGAARERGRRRGQERGPQPQAPRPPQQQQAQRPQPPPHQRRPERPQRGDRGTRDPRANLDLRETDAGPDDAPELVAARAAELPATTGAATPRLTQAARQLARADDGEPEAAHEAWGTDLPGPAPAVALTADLPLEVADADPLTAPLLTGPGAALDDVATVVGVRFVVGGRVTWCDAGDADWAVGDRVLADSERGARLAWIAVAPQRRGVRDRNLRRIVRRATEQDTPRDDATALRAAKDAAAALRLPLKVFRVETQGAPGRGGKVLVYYTSDEQRLDVRELLRDVSAAVGARVELRQLGVRDEAKAVGGIGSCGLTLCCTTWLPDFVPVSIKMAKDQGLVLTPSKVSGQCGRLKCCLVYEQAAYAELRKGLPKLGKRVIGARGEGRVVEVDVLRQRLRVSYGPGDTEVVPATEVKPMFPPGGAAAAAREAPDDDHDEPDPDPDPSALPS